MALKRSYDSQEDIPEGMESFYVERDGQWMLDAEPGDADRNAEDVRRAMRARDNEKAEREKLRKELDAMKERIGDIDLDRLPDIQEVQKKLEESEHQKLIDEKKFEEAAERKFHRQIQEMTRKIEALEGAVNERETSLSSLQSDFASRVIDDSLQQAYIESGGDPVRSKYAVQALREAWEFDKENRKPTPIQKLDDGSVVTAIGADGKPLTMKEQVSTFLRDEPWFQLGSTGTNSAHQPSQNGQGSRFRISGDEIKANFSRYEQVKAEAEKAGVPVEITG